MSQGLTNAYAEIHYLNQEGYAGSGFLIDEKHLVTCSHVLNDALGDIPLAVGARNHHRFTISKSKKYRYGSGAFLSGS